MGAMFAAGSIGAASQTVWFGTLPDRLNMLCPYNYPTEFITSSTPANYGNLWTNFNSSFGATTTAPDGTTANSQLLVEDSSNNIHFCQAGTNADRGALAEMNCGILRLAGFFKNFAAHPRRVGFLAKSDFGGVLKQLTVVFDLAGGQIGAAAAVTGSDTVSIIKPMGTQIIAMPASFGGGGWYLCIQDMFWRNSSNTYIIAEIFLDQGTGTGALNNSFVGDGQSGAYVWRTNMMPLAAYGINNQIFFDDFTSISTIDVNNTQAPGFNWYPHHGWAHYNTASPDPFPANQISVANSILTLTGPSDTSEIAIGTASQTNAATGAFVGQGFGAGKATLYELKANWDYFAHTITPGATLTWWGASLEWIVSQGKGVLATVLQNGRELDIMEASGTAGNANPDTDALAYQGNNLGGEPGGGTFPISRPLGNPGCLGYPAWSSIFPYRAGGSDIVMQGGLAYQSKGAGGNTNQMPPNATFWTPVTYPTNLNQPAVLVDLTQMHVWSSLVVPYWGQPGVSAQIAQQATMLPSTANVTGSVPDAAVGIKFDFFDGAMICMTASWGANLIATEGGVPSGVSTYLYSSDSQNLAIWLAPGGTTGQKFNIDYFKVMQ